MNQSKYLPRGVAKLDKTHPPMSVRRNSLAQLTTKDLFAWASGISASVENRADAIEAILQYEYDEPEPEAKPKVKPKVKPIKKEG